MKASTKPPSGKQPAGSTQRCWLVKSEPESFSWDDLCKLPSRTTPWDGVRNYQARNSMRDDMKKGDLVLFYHSNATPPIVVGVAEVVRESYPDATAFDAKSKYFDPKSNPEAPTWMLVDIKAVKRFSSPVSLQELRSVKGLESMALLQKGSRLSVQPVSKDEFDIVCGMGMV